MIRIGELHQRAVAATKVMKEISVGAAGAAGEDPSVDLRPEIIFVHNENAAAAAMWRVPGEGREQILRLARMGIDALNPVLLVARHEAYVRADPRPPEGYVPGQFQKEFQEGSPNIVECIVVHTVGMAARRVTILAFRYKDPSKTLEWIDEEELFFVGGEMDGIPDIIQSFMVEGPSGPLQQMLRDGAAEGMSEPRVRGMCFEAGAEQFGCLHTFGPVGDLLGENPPAEAMVYRRVKGEG